MPLMMLPMAPGVRAEPGQQPDSGHRHGAAAAQRCWRATTWQALPYIPPVVGRDAGLLLAGDSLGREPVQHRDRCCSARASGWTCGLWLKHLLRDREATPSLAEAMFCGVLILMIQFFLSFALAGHGRRRDLLRWWPRSRSWSSC